MLPTGNIANALVRRPVWCYDSLMKVIEIRKDNRTDETIEVSWGNVITKDFSVISSVMNIIEMKREQEERRAQDDHNPVLDRFTTIAIHIEL